MPFLDLPYDVRYAIYQHLFPRVPQLYLHAASDGLRYLPQQDAEIPVAWLRVNRALHVEGSEYLYNNYLLNIVGRKQDCLSHYTKVLATVKKYARTETHLRAFSNGLGSSTGAMSIAVGDAKLEMLENRQRGDPKSMDQFAQEAQIMKNVSWGMRDGHRRLRLNQAIFWWTFAIVVTGFGLLLAWAIGRLLKWLGLLS